MYKLQKPTAIKRYQNCLGEVSRCPSPPGSEAQVGNISGVAVLSLPKDQWL